MAYGEEEMHRSIDVVRWQGDSSCSNADEVVVEEPLEIRLNDAPLAITMRTPGHDEALAIGFLVTEGIIRSPEDLYDITRCAERDHPDLLNIVNVVVAPDSIPHDLATGRQRYATASCGLCGRAAIEHIRAVVPSIESTARFSRGVLSSLPDKLRAAQNVFSRTGGLHAAGLFTAKGGLIHLAEDVGRHNAVDKVVGLAFRSGPWPPHESILMVSGRAGFEIVQKALSARIPSVCSVSAPSSLAVELARDANLVMAGFVRGESLNIYAGEDRVVI